MTQEKTPKYDPIVHGDYIVTAKQADKIKQRGNRLKKYLSNLGCIETASYTETKANTNTKENEH